MVRTKPDRANLDDGVALRIETRGLHVEKGENMRDYVCKADVKNIQFTDRNGYQFYANVHNTDLTFCQNIDTKLGDGWAETLSYDTIFNVRWANIDVNDDYAVVRGAKALASHALPIWESELTFGSYGLPSLKSKLSRLDEWTPAFESTFNEASVLTLQEIITTDMNQEVSKYWNAYMVAREPSSRTGPDYDIYRKLYDINANLVKTIQNQKCSLTNLRTVKEPFQNWQQSNFITDLQDIQHSATRAVIPPSTESDWWAW